ncbi:SDR family NAD(P)-dependent oxidoreductase [Rhizobium lusitanum]|uniref:SDR family NAD(P)-dependent oxidoreductase n=1 Tax=Rhizobium lusitanum TaxID=293958 RepID=UPI001572FDF9|nr:SDR family NAD(P)-dependent oxidoreductase [Rhizobium lusitanum]NTJ11797.1 SDR family oxidoreductase [Rhizobium lusitanum]
MFDFKGKTAVITGAGSGIGKATAEYFRDCGANVVAADIRFPPGVAVPDGMLQADYDASDPQSASALVAAAVARFGPIDYLVLCAGIWETHLAQEMTDEQWRKTISVNLDGPFFLIRRAVGHMNDGGAIVAFASIAAHQGGSLAHSHYGASKGGVLALVRGLARDLGPKLRVNAISPGTTKTPMAADLISNGGESLINSIPLKRLGEPIEMAKVSAFLCSDAASYITGEAIIVSGGLYMG